MRLLLLLILASCASAPPKPKLPPTVVTLDHKWFRVHYDPKLRLARYVEYTLKRENLLGKAGSRRDHFIPDPQLERMNLPHVVPEEYKKTGYDRGHLAPAADFSFSQEANDETFVMSNIAPQSKTLNRGAWLKLEKEVRRWACGEEKLTVITGPVFSKSDARLPSGLTVPGRFFKIIVDETPPRKARAYIYQQSDPKTVLEERRVSTADVERETGISFPQAFPKDGGTWKSEDCQPKPYR